MDGRRVSAGRSRQTALQSVRRVPEGEDRREMGQGARDDKSGEKNDNLAGVSRQVSPPAGQHENRDRDREVGSSNAEVGDSVQRDEVWSPEQTVAVGHEGCRPE